ncbi:protein of unknown function [Methanoculleus bourgensis]|uniref:Uncharacterized protein n=1 Tax=Methanoculleus bourgensis TaxID=83986 RepID=A0A0X3BL31_9EURY|nr:protein of unknown function [Methanoculleus bourgensis]
MAESTRRQCGPGTTVPALATLTALQQVFSRFPAGAVRIALPEMALNQGILVHRVTLF